MRLKETPSQTGGPYIHIGMLPAVAGLNTRTQEKLNILSSGSETIRIEGTVFDGSGGIVMDVGVWHEVPFPFEARTNFVCICTNETNVNLEAQGPDGECLGGDLNKKNIAKNLGYTFEIDVTDIQHT